jgi:hypothetical protein
VLGKVVRELGWKGECLGVVCVCVCVYVCMYVCMCRSNYDIIKRDVLLTRLLGGLCVCVCVCAHRCAIAVDNWE